MSTFVLVPGACHGGWWYEPLAQLLEQDGHAAIPLTLAGLEHEPRLDRLITLATHVDQVAASVPEDADTVLVGHSYAGSVITGVADRFPGRIAALVYLDAFLPETGDSCWSLTNDDQRAWYVAGCARTGYGVDPLPFFDRRARPQPVATLLQALELTGAWRDVPTKHYVAASWPGESPMTLSTRRAEADPTMAVHYWNTRHNVMAEGPDLVLQLLRALPGYAAERAEP
ncbi:alpha/beta fold hydrolase [Actinospica sp.]|uniref:alpha/beta fold hydrolase n=1 Tax=Actinospica sp. TaxID=1872142 RepID=UPI002B57298C|nr:alpha/beta fold hydrolase [Actinospica sp.]HWG25878.1 alpha/beta fold hydrolase [Actinospica sp.]